MGPFICGFVAVVIGAVGFAGPAGATPGSDITSEPLAEARIPPGLFSATGGTDLVARKITIAPGGSTGWHYHDGPVYGFVAAGILTHPGPDCAAPEFHPGEFIYEEAGVRNTHIGRNLGAEPVVLYVIYAPPAGAPLFRDAAAPGCA